MPPRTASRPRQTVDRQAPSATAMPIPFIAAAHEHLELINQSTFTPTAAVQPSSVIDVTAYGYLRHILLEVTATGGTLGAGVLHPDYPFNQLTQIGLQDVNGANMMTPIDGFALLQLNIWGGYAASSDPRNAPSYIGTINSKFFLRIPVEISRHNALGAIGNQNAASAYKLTYSINATTAMFTTPVTTAPNIQVKAHLEAWTQPNEFDHVGRPQALVPPMHGTAQYVSQIVGKAVVAGNNTVQFTRVGNYLRYLIIISRSNAANTPRDDTVMVDPITIQWDARTFYSESQAARVFRTEELLMGGATRDTGVFVYPFNWVNTGGTIGDESPALWLPTAQSTRLELNGVAATAGTFQIVTVDVAPVEVVPTERFVWESESGFHPAAVPPAQATA